MDVFDLGRPFVRGAASMLLGAGMTILSIGIRLEWIGCAVADALTHALELLA